MRMIIGQSMHVAQLRHTCDLCDHPIFPLDTYERTAMRHRDGRYSCIVVRKEHVQPYCPYDDPRYDEYEEGCVRETHPGLPYLLAA